MINNRIGRTMELEIEVLTDGEKTALSGRDLSLELYDARGKVRIPIEDYTLSGNKLTFTIEGKLQSETMHLGEWNLSLWENKGKASQNVCDWISFLNMVPSTNEEGE